jgi:hypothetical protein
VDSAGNGDGQHELEREIERYREATISALGQLEWVVGYLNKIHKPQIARAVDRNRRQILQRVEAGDH